MDQDLQIGSQQTQPVTPAPKNSGTFKWLLIILILVIMGGGGYWYYTNNIRKESSVTSPSPSISSQGSRATKQEVIINNNSAQKTSAEIGIPNGWLPVSKQENAKLYSDVNIILYPTISDKEKEENFRNQNTTMPSGTPQPAYLRIFDRDSRFIGINFIPIEEGQETNLKADDEIHQKESTFDKILVDDKKSNGIEYHCLQSKKDQKYNVYCTAKISGNYLATYSLFTNIENYDSDISKLYGIIESTVIKL